MSSGLTRMTISCRCPQGRDPYGEHDDAPSNRWVFETDADAIAWLLKGEH